MRMTGIRRAIPLVCSPGKIAVSPTILAAAPKYRSHDRKIDHRRRFKLRAKPTTKKKTPVYGRTLPKLGIAETIRSIEENGSWMVLKRIEQHPEYRQMLFDTLAEIRPLANTATGGMLGCEGFVFISSPGSETPFHFDPEHNILLQIRGQKTITVFPADDETIVPPEAHEAFHMGEQHRNQIWRDEFASKGLAVSLVSGEAIHVPVKAPHWVQNGAEVSFSLSITWRSEWSYAEADARACNRTLRKIGLRPESPAPFPANNKGKALVYRALRRTTQSLTKVSPSRRSA